jgi:tRNA G10  N-methylase Trm11
MTLQERVRGALRVATEKGIFDSKAFFRSWFREHGSVYFFLFTKNLKVTNMQVAELHALLRTYIASKDTRTRVRDFQLLSVQEFDTSVQSLFQSFLPYGGPWRDSEFDQAINVVAELYTDLLKDIVCIQLFFGSCAVFLPCSMDIKLLPICAESGYVHSCGASILNRNTAKATKDEVFRRLREHLDRRGITKAKLVVYAHEDFTRHDRRLAKELKDGLDDVKIHVEKYYIGKDSLVQTLKDLRSDSELGSRIEVMDPSHYAKGLSVRDVPVIWLLVDHKPKAEIRTRSDEQYYILYQQEFKNECAFHIFDENKPAWIDHTTIPHTLTAAMINITRPWWPEKLPVLVDPFLGTGTTWFEALKFGIIGRCVDKEVIVEEMVRDNLEFFSLSSQELLRLSAAVWLTAHLRTTRMESLAGMPENKYESLFNDDEFRRAVARDYDSARELFKAVCPDHHKHEVAFDRASLKALRESDLRKRIFFYLALRTHRRNLAAIERETVLWSGAYQGEAMQLAEQMEEFQELLFRREGERIEEGYAVFNGKYSDSCSTPMLRLHEAHKADSSRLTVRCADATDCRELDDSSCDLIITDPPYGLNAEYERYDLAKLIRVVLDRMVRSMRDGGQIVLAVPDWSHIGKQVPFFSTKQFVTQEILACAEREKREIVMTAHSVPMPADAFRPPYYWESDRALRRAILLFRFRDLRERRPKS